MSATGPIKVGGSRRRVRSAFRAAARNETKKRPGAKTSVNHYIGQAAPKQWDVYVEMYLFLAAIIYWEAALVWPDPKQNALLGHFECPRYLVNKD